MKTKINQVRNPDLRSMSKIKAFFLGSIFLFSLSLPAVASAGLCDEIAKGTKGFFSCGQETTSFTDFKGGLTKPETTGYSDELRQAENVRDYIKNVVKFALGFLGIIAIVVIIYGGFLYLTAAGKEDKAGTGKKTITYAVIGLLIIMASFAIVNTVLQAPSGKEGDKLAGAAPGSTGDQNTRRRLLFNYAAGVVQTVARDFVTAYQNYAEIGIDLKTLASVDLERDADSPATLKSILSNKINIVKNISNKGGALSQVAEKSKDMLVVLERYIKTTDKKLAEASAEKAEKKWYEFWRDAEYNTFKINIDEQTGGTGALQRANESDFALAVQKAYRQLIDLRKRVKQSALLRDVDLQFVVVLNDLRKLVDSLLPEIEPAFGWLLNKALAQSLRELKLTGTADNAAILTIVNNLGKLYDLVKDIQFIYTVISADVTEGNAPLVVNFDGLKSLDPNNQTIPAANFKWNFGDDSDDNKAEKIVTASHIYKKPGTYIVKLEVKAPDTAPGEQKIADGIAFRTITVKPSASRIDLKVSADETFPADKTFNLSQYNDAGFQTANLSDITFTMSEAKNGIYFNALETKTGGGELLSKLSGKSTVKVKWDFGDKTKKDNTYEGTSDPLNLKRKFIYDREGSYRVTLEVTDDRGITDRKIFNIVVASIAARMRFTPGTIVDKWTKVTVDGSTSSSDLGSIKSYKWEFSELPTDDFVKPAETVDRFDIGRFKKAGGYTVSLEVADNSGRTAKTSAVLTVTSKPPVAQFTAFNKDKSHPNIYILDGTASYSVDSGPDEKMELKWEINAAPGDCAYFTLKDEGKTFSETKKDCTELGREGDIGWSSQNSKLKVKLKKGKYTVTLVARNPADPANTKGGKTQEQKLIVEKDLDVGWGDDGRPFTAQLNESGKSEIVFSIKSENGVAYEIDTGDSQKEKGKINPDPSVPTIVKHTYDQAGSYIAKLSVFDAEDNSNTLTRKIFIGGGNKPVAAIHVIQDGIDLPGGTDMIIGNRKSVFVFDAGKSLNVDGASRHLNYSWDFGNFEKSAKKQATYTYKEANPREGDFYTVKLKVTNDEDATKSAEESLKIRIIREPPIVRGIIAVPAGQKLTTPVSVNVSALGAEDPDGKIIQYRWWYYDVDNPDNLLGLQITQSPSATLTVGTNGEENQRKIYKFGVAVTDDDNMTFDTGKELNEALVPSITVTNGPNKAPVAKFSVDRTSIDVGESVTFNSTSFDPDTTGSIVRYIWDFEGRGFAAASLTDDYNQPNVTYTYAKPAKTGFKARLKVVDNNGAEAVSDAVLIYVEGKSGAPTAAFISKQVGTDKKMQFTDNSIGDAVNGASIKKWTWDFDVNTDSDGDGIKDNDQDSTEQNPAYEYQNYGIYRAKLTVEDDQGNQAKVTNFVNVKAPEKSSTDTKTLPPKTDSKSGIGYSTDEPEGLVKKLQRPKGATTPLKPAPTSGTDSQSAEKLEARLLSVPAPSEADGRIHLQGDSATVIFDFSNSKGNIKSYVFDKNIFFDSNGNGVKDDDEDYKTDKPGTWTTQYARSYGAVRTRLTILDMDGKKAFVDKDIIFDPPVAPKGKKPKNPLQTALFSGYDILDLPVLLVLVAGFVIFISRDRLRLIPKKRQTEDEVEDN